MKPKTTIDKTVFNKLTRLVGHLVCPHCWYRFRITDLVWVARHEDLAGDPIVPDTFVRFRASRFNVKGVALDARGLPCEGLACPNCHLAISRVLLENRPLIFSIIGVLGSGKSYYLTSMVWELRRLLPTYFSITFTDADPVNNMILNGYEKTFFLQSNPEDWVYLDKTQVEGEHYDKVHLGDQNVSLPHPFLFILRPTGDHPKAQTAEQMSRILCFYDNAGEHYQPGMDSASSPATQHLAQSKVLMFLYDPTQDPRFRKRCLESSKDPQLFDGRTVEQQETILTEAALRVRTYADISPSTKLDQPLIVLVAKSDIWAQLIDEDIRSEPYIEPGRDKKLGQVDIGRIERVSEKVRKLLREVSPEFVAAAEDYCNQVVYIPISALGGSPKRQEETDYLLVRQKDIHPRWVTVPILYAFEKWATGFVSSK